MFVVNSICAVVMKHMKRKDNLINSILFFLHSETEGE